MIWGTAAQAALARSVTAAEIARTLPMKPKNRLLPIFTSLPKPVPHTKGVANLCTARNYSTETRLVGMLRDEVDEVGRDEGRRGTRRGQSCEDGAVPLVAGRSPATTQPSPNQFCLGLCLGQRLH